MTKRLFDLSIATAALVLLAPLLLAIAILIRRDSPGPVLFRQVRVGRHGVPFEILKFRTMAHFPGESCGPQISVAGDRRITHVGTWLRRLKLDELPQLLNVVRGDMSLVGPRPEVPRYVELYPESARNEVLSVRPGITDEASIEFSQEGEILARAVDPERCYIDEILPRKIELYRKYVQSRSFFGDAGILFRTIVRLAGRHRAGRSAG